MTTTELPWEEDFENRYALFRGNKDMMKEFIKKVYEIGYDAGYDKAYDNS